MDFTDITFCAHETLGIFQALKHRQISGTSLATYGRSTTTLTHTERRLAMKFSTFAATAALALGMVTQAHAAALTLDTSGSPTYQQTMNSPCVIGDPSCNNPSGFGST